MQFWEYWLRFGCLTTGEVHNEDRQPQHDVCEGWLWVSHMAPHLYVVLHPNWMHQVLQAYSIV